MKSNISLSILYEIKQLLYYKYLSRHDSGQEINMETTHHRHIEAT